MIKLYNFDELRPEEILNRDIRAEKNVEDVVDRQTIGIKTRSRHTCCPKFAKPSPAETGTRLPHSHSQTSTAKYPTNPGENRSSALALSPPSANSASPRDTMKTPFLTIAANSPSIQPLPPWHTKRLMA